MNLPPALSLRSWRERPTAAGVHDAPADGVVGADRLREAAPARTLIPSPDRARGGEIAIATLAIAAIGLLTLLGGDQGSETGMVFVTVVVMLSLSVQVSTRVRHAASLLPLRLVGPPARNTTLTRFRGEALLAFLRLQPAAWATGLALSLSRIGSGGWLGTGLFVVGVAMATLMAVAGLTLAVTTVPRPRWWAAPLPVALPSTIAAAVFPLTDVFEDVPNAAIALLVPAGLALLAAAGWGWASVRHRQVEWGHAAPA